MTSEPQRAFVWVWLPGAADPVVAGRLDIAGTVITFTYGRSYLARKDRIAPPPGAAAGPRPDLTAGR
jgi:serine/threonine-protein kinase HipA